MPKMIPRWQRRLLLWSALGLALTGMGQMPIFSRYSIAALPGLGWLGNFRITAAVHLALAAVFLFVLTAMTVAWLGTRERPRVPFWSAAWAFLLGGVAVTGFLRVLQNGALPLFNAGTVRYLDWSHLGLAVALGLVAACRRRPKPRAA